MTKGFTLNGVHSSTFGIICKTVRRLLPARTLRETEIPGRDGTFDFGSPTWKKGGFSFTCSFINASMTDLRTQAHAIAAWAAAATTLIFDDDPGIVWTGRISNAIDLANNIFLGQFTLTFDAQPYGEDVNTTTGTIGTAQDYGSGFEFYPVITVTKSGSTATSLQVMLASTGEFVRVVDSIASGDLLVFDMSTGKVTKNGIACMTKVSIDSLFFGVPPGNQTISVTTTSTYTASISYKKRYL
jgi:predicted phage tail component-like protein